MLRTAEANLLLKMKKLSMATQNDIVDELIVWSRGNLDNRLTIDDIANKAGYLAVRAHKLRGGARTEMNFWILLSVGISNF